MMTDPASITTAAAAALRAVDPSAKLRDPASRYQAHLAAWIHSDRLPWPVACVAKLDRVILRPNHAAATSAVRTPDQTPMPAFATDAATVGEPATDAVVAAIVAAYHELLAAYAE